MSVKSDNYQIGLSATPANNFVWSTDGAGSILLQRGVVTGGVVVPTQTILTIDPSGNISTTLGGLGTTGQFASFMLPSAPAGWVAGNGGTIGNASSGATRANADTQALFTAWWGAYTDAQLPILTNAGGASTRGASAAADWSAGKRLTVFDVTGRFVRNANGTTVVNGTKYAESVGPHNHAITQMVALPGTGGTSGYTYNNAASGAPLGAGNTQNNVGTETAPVNIAMLGCFKL